MHTILDSIGSTPLVRLGRLVPASSAAVHVKLEYVQPTGSYKDRMALAIIEAAEQRGELRAGMTVLECTGGSTGTSLAFVCAVKGYACRLISSDAYSHEKLASMRAFGAEVIVEPSRGGVVTPDLWPRMLARADALRADPGIYYVNQHHNRDAQRGYARMGAEIASSLAHVDALCAMVGTAGMLMGVAAELRRREPDLRVVALEPSTSAVLSGAPAGSHGVDGTAAGFVPPQFDRALVSEVRALDESRGRALARSLAEREGIFAGTSTGMNVLAALELASEIGPGHDVVTVACDSGLKYLAGPLFR